VPASVGVAVVGLLGAIPPVSLVPAFTLPNCDLLVVAQFLNLVLPVSGTAAYQVHLPNDPSLPGTVISIQFFQLELGASGFVSPSGSTANVCGVGSF
jgi:hypothetical protein